MRQTLNRGEFYGVVGVVIQLRKVGDHEIKPSVFCCIGGLKTIESHRLVCDRIHDRAAVERGDGNVVRLLNRSVLNSKQVLFRSVVIGGSDAKVTPQLLFVPGTGDRKSTRLNSSH